MYHSDTRRLLDSSQHKHPDLFLIKDKTAMTKHYFNVTSVLIVYEIMYIYHADRKTRFKTSARA